MNVSNDPQARERLVKALRQNWWVEMEGAATYRKLAEEQPDRRRRTLLTRLADGEILHARRWEQRLRDLGETPPGESPAEAAWLAQIGSLDAALKRLESEEESHIDVYRAQSREVDDPEFLNIVNGLVEDERRLAGTLRGMTSERWRPPRSRLD